MTPLEDLLRQCTVKITVPGGWGTGFFVAPELILTCAHVVRKAADSQVTVSYPAWQQPLSAIVKVKADDGKTLDLALVELSEPLTDHPCVLLDEEPVAIGQALYSYGYLESYANAAPVHPVNEGETGDTPPLLKLQGAQVEKGISGAALLNLKTGKVCGIVKETRAAGFDLGGGAIPTRVILEQFPELRELQQQAHQQDLRWAKLLPETTSEPSQIVCGDVIAGDKVGGDKIGGDKIGTQINYYYSQETGNPTSSKPSSLSEIDFQPYREAVISHYSQQRHLYTPTDALLPLEARSVERQAQYDGQKQQREKTVEQFPVLEGLRKYALGNQREHVLLAGRPGSGKSTTLRQLAVALAEEGQVPVFVQLKGDRPVLETIASELEKGDLYDLEPKEIKRLLRQQRFVLLLDGVNEIPNDDLRRKLAEFREDNPTVPMIFTTRDLSLGGDLGIGKRLEMKPLSEPQMREFVGKYLPEHGERLLGQLRDRLRELAETPLLLKLLCDVFDPGTNQIPQNQGELFRCFDRDYKRIKKEVEYVPVSENFWEFKSEILQYLAFSMIQGEAQTTDRQKPPEPWLTIPKSRAAEILETWLHQRGMLDAPTKAKLWLKDLCSHHFLQDAAKPDEIEFHHQLFQEYYAAEYLLAQLRQHPEWLEKEDGEDYTYFQKEYLNYLKWTEPIALMLALTDEDAQALRVVKLALDEVDLMLGARLAGEVKPEFQPQTVEFVKDLEALDWLKVELLGETRSDFVLNELCKILQDESYYPDMRKRVAFALIRLGSDNALKAIKKLKNKDLGIYRIVVFRNPDLEPDFYEFLRSLGNDESDSLYVAKEKLEEIGSAILGLLEESNHNTCESTVDTSRRLTTEEITEEIKNLGNPDEKFRRSAADTLGTSKVEEAIPALSKVLKEDSSWEVRQSAASALGQIGQIVPKQVIPILLNIIESSGGPVAGYAAKALVQIDSDDTIPALLKALESGNSEVRLIVGFALGNFRGDRAAYILPSLLQLIPTQSGEDAFTAIQGIQANCKFYNYDLWQAHVAAQQGDLSTSQRSRSPSTTIYNIDRVGNLNTGSVNIHGDQTGGQNP